MITRSVGGDAIDSIREVLNVMISNQLQLDVQEELKWDPKVDARHIVVTAHEAAVTLTGYVPTYFDKMRAIAAAEHVHGVKAVADELEVHLHQAHSKEDSDIADSVIHILEWNTALSDQDIKATISNGRVTLTGEVDWNYQRDEAERAVDHLVGVTSITNQITVKPRVAAAKVEKQITNALARHAALDARQIHVTMSGTKAVLSGHVHCFDEARIARNAAWSAPGISAVDDHLLVIHPQGLRAPKDERAASQHLADTAYGSLIE
jgi:VCBS repeat-containing protein